MSKDVVVFGDSGGIRGLLSVIPTGRVGMIVSAERRPQYDDDLRQLASRIGAEYCLHPFAKKADQLVRFANQVNSLNAAYLVINSYSMKVPSSIVNYYRGRIVNVHYSLLPMNRGPHPENWALIHGHEKTGVTLHHVDADIDTGSVIYQREVVVHRDDTWVTLLARLSLTAHDHVLPYVGSVIRSFASFEPGIPQDAADHASNHSLDADYPRLDPSLMNDLEMFNLIRAQVFPLRGAYFDGPEGRCHIDYFVPLEEIPALRKRMACLS